MPPRGVAPIVLFVNLECGPSSCSCDRMCEQVQTFHSSFCKFVNAMAQKRKAFKFYKVRLYRRHKLDLKRLYCTALHVPYGQESASYCINKCRSRLNACLVLKPGFESQEGNRSLGLYSSIYSS